MTHRFKRINYYGGPGSGKSTTAALTFANLRLCQYETDWVQEPIKHWTYIDRAPTGYDQNTIFSKQVELEDICLRNNKLDFVVNDAPLLMHCYYGYKYKRPGWQANLELARVFESDYPSINIFLNRGDIKYSEVGRYQNESEAKAMDADILSFVRSEISVVEFKTTEFAIIIDYIKNLLGEPVNDGK